MDKPLFQNTILPTTKTNVWQHIFSSQVYGTFFAIHINLITDESEYSKLKTAQFKLINYKGPINIGIDKVDLTANKDSIDVIVHVQGLNEKRTSEIKDLPIDIFDPNDMPIINIHRKITPLNSGSDYKGQVFDSEYYYRDIEGDKYDAHEYDREFLSYRDDDDDKPYEGADLSRRCPRGLGRIPNINRTFTTSR